MPAIPPHKTATTDSAWDGPAAKANLKNDGDAAYYRKAYAWVSSDGDPKTKAAYKFIHHMVASGGAVGAANTVGCSSGIAVLNGGRGGTKIPDGDRKGVYSHLAKHIKDAGKEAPDLSSYADYEKALEAANKAKQVPLGLGALAHGRPWAIKPETMDELRAEAARFDLEAVAARVGQPLAGGNGRVENHNGTAVLDIRGPLFRYRSIFTWLLGGTAVEDTSIGLHAALDDPAIKNIVLAINSPGGQIDGINELADMIRAANNTKPVTAYVDGLAASGAYWLASAAGKIVADETAQLGSIGVLATVVDDRDADEKRGVKRYDVVSSQSPLKRTDPATDEGRAQLQQTVDAMAQVFIAKVAKFRGTSETKVQSDFGQGAVMPARSAVSVGMADSLGSLEGLLRGEDSSGAPVRRVNDKPGMRVLAAAPFDEEELEEETESTELNDDSSCNCPPGTETCECGAEDGDDKEDDDKEDDADEDDEDGEGNGTEQKPDTSSIPKGEADLIKPTEERQRIAAILTCEEAKGREELAQTLALKTNHTVDAAKELLKAAPTASKTNGLEARMGTIPNPKVGVPGDAGEEDTPAAEVRRIIAFVPKERLRAHAQRVQ